MRPTLALVASVLLAAVLVACGDGFSKPGASPTSPGGGADTGVVGAWGIDVEKSVANGFAAAKAGLARAREELAKVPPEMRATVEARLPKDDAAIQVDVERNTRTTTLDVDLRADGTARIVFKTPNRGSTREGVWELKGEGVWITAKTKDGVAATGADAEPQVFVRREGVLVLLDDRGNQVFWLKRK